MERKVKLIIASILLCNPLELQADTRFKEDLHTGFLRLCLVFLAVEKEFGFEFTEEEADHMLTIGDVVNHVEGR